MLTFIHHGLLANTKKPKNSLSKSLRVDEQCSLIPTSLLVRVIVFVTFNYDWNQIS